jgi:hypothetical protein
MRDIKVPIIPNRKLGFTRCEELAKYLEYDSSREHIRDMADTLKLMFLCPECTLGEYAVECNNLLYAAIEIPESDHVIKIIRSVFDVL